MGLILLIILIILLVPAFQYRPEGYGYAPMSLVTILLIVLVILLVTGSLHIW